MSAAHNKAIVRRCWEEMLNTGNLRIAEEYIAPDYIDHQPDQEIKGIEGVKHFVTGIRAAVSVQGATRNRVFLFHKPKSGL